MCCRNCAQRLQTIDKSLQKFKETYDIVRNRLTVSHGHKTTKRMSKEHQDSSKRKALFQPVEQEEGIETDQADSSFDIPPQVRYTLASAKLH